MAQSAKSYYSDFCLLINKKIKTGWNYLSAGFIYITAFFIANKVFLKLPEPYILEKKDNNSLAYIPQLDSLRAIAVLLVIISHWFPKEHLLNKYTPNGFFGVTIFFVLSGYLITRILLNYRNRSEEEGISKVKLLKQFYIRRSLRIFPVYYLTLFIVAILNIDHIREVLGWHLSYTSNFLFFNSNMWTAAAHLWSLAVEEQFYLIWPLLILFIPRKYLLHCIIGFILMAPVFRVLVNNMSPSKFINILTPSCFDAFGIGALMAYSSFVPESKLAAKFPRFLGVSFIISCIFFLFIALSMAPGENIYARPEIIAFGRIFFSFISLFMIYYAARGIKGPAKWILENRVIIYTGKISYSLYLFHNFLPDVLHYFNIDLIYSPLNISIQFLLLLILSTISWYAFERPINNLKNRLSKPAAPQEEASSAISA